MRLELDALGKIKTYIHTGHAAFLFLAWVLTVAIFTREGHSDGRIGWYFGLCWLTIPILIYLVMVPMWSRARRFSNVYAFAALDAISVVLWLSAWASVASYVAAGKGKGKKDKGSGCDNFGYGSPGRCKLSEAVTFFGVIMMTGFIATSYFSFRSVMHFKRTGITPSVPGKSTEFSTQTQDAFSSNMHPEDFEDDRNTDGRQNGYVYSKQSLDDEYAPVYQHDHDDVSQMRPTQPRGPLNQNGLGLHSYDTSYEGAGGSHRPVFSRENHASRRDDQ